ELSFQWFRLVYPRPAGQAKFFWRRQGQGEMALDPPRELSYKEMRPVLPQARLGSRDGTVSHHRQRPDPAVIITLRKDGPRPERSARGGAAADPRPRRHQVGRRHRAGFLREEVPGAAAGQPRLLPVASSAL